jgi:Tfp pilus assembly protein PilX
MNPQRPNPAATATRGEAGSAYIVVLLVLVVLAIFGIALSLITQTESQIGANERTINRAFYAGEAGIRRAIVRALVKDDHTPQSFFYTDSGQAFVGGKLELGTQVDVTAFHPIQVSACNLCEVNSEDTYSGKAYKKVTHAVTSRATRFATLNAGGTKTPIAQKTISAMIAVEPYMASVTSLATVNDPAELAKIKF